MRSVGMAAAAAIVAAAGAAQAHSPYLLPNTFDATNRDHVTVEASFTEAFFAPDVVMKSDDFHAVGPDGARVALTPTYLRDLTILEPATPVDGTWRISTGARTGRTAKAVLKAGGEWEFIEPGKPVPAGAVDMVSLTRAETYVTRGKPNETALKPTGQGLEFRALTHPNDIAVGAAARFEVLLDGKPLAKQAVEIHQGGETYSEANPVEAVSDFAGVFAFTPPAAGVYHAMSRYRIAPAAAGQPARSLTYALTFEAVP